MGCDSQIIYGWKVDYEQLVTYLLNHGISKDLIERIGARSSSEYVKYLPNNWVIISFDSSPDCKDKDRAFYLSLIIGNYTKINNFMNELNTSELDKAKEMAIEMNCKHTEPLLMTDVHYF